MLRKPGEAVRAGEPVLELHTESADRIAGALEALAGALDIASEAPAVPPLTMERIDA
jgi:thymidine phosphorylase